MNRNRKIVMALGGAVAAVAVTVLAAGVVDAQQPAPGKDPLVMQGGPMMGRPGMMARRAKALGLALGQLNLTDQQKQQVKGILQAQKPKAQALGAQAREAGRALREAVAGGADEATIRARAADLGKVQADAAVLRAQIRKEVFALLTPEQQAKANEMRQRAEARAERMQQGRGWRK